MSDQADIQSMGRHTVYGISNIEEAFDKALQRKVAPFYVAVDQVDEILQQYIGDGGNITYQLFPINEQAVTQPLTGDLNCNGKKVVNIGVVPDLSSLAGILGSGSTAVNVNTMDAYMNLYSALNLILANPLVQTSAGFKGLRLSNVGDAQIPTNSDSQPILEEKIKGVLTIAQLLNHFPTDILGVRDALDTNNQRPFFNCDERVLQRLLDPIVDQDAVTLKFLKDITLNRGSVSGGDYDAGSRRISAVLEPETVIETMTQPQKDLNLARATNQKFIRDQTISKINTAREEPTGTITYNQVFDAKGLKLQNLANATKDQDAVTLGQANSKFIAKDGTTIDVGGKKLTNGIAGTSSTDLIIKSQLDAVQTSLQNTIDDLGGSGGSSLLDIISLGASLTSIGLNLANLGLGGVGTGLTALQTIGATALSAGVLGLASVQQDGSGTTIQQSNMKIASDINNYTPDYTKPSNWAEQAVDINRLIQAQNDLKTAFGVDRVGSAWLNSVLYAPAMLQKQNLGVFDVII